MRSEKELKELVATAITMTNKGSMEVAVLVRQSEFDVVQKLLKGKHGAKAVEVVVEANEGKFKPWSVSNQWDKEETK